MLFVDNCTAYPHSAFLKNEICYISVVIYKVLLYFLPNTDIKNSIDGSGNKNILENNHRRILIRSVRVINGNTYMKKNYNTKG